MSVLFTDNFNRADANPLAGNWTTQGGSNPLQLLSNVAQGTAGTVPNSAYVNSISAPADCYAQCKNVVSLVNFPNGGGGPMVRMTTGALNGYGVQQYPSVVVIFKYTAGTYSELDNQPDTYAVGDLLRIEIRGSSIKGFKNGAQVVSGTDSSFAAGSVGAFIFNNSGAQLDDYEVGDFGAATDATSWVED